MEQNKSEILHIFVIGFHHKKGCQIEFSYPEIKELPEEWRNLPSLAMPDGAHNYESDGVFFHLPSLDEDRTLFGISCFQQVPVEKVKNRTPDMVRGTVQKAVCVISKVPLYGYIQIKLELITAAYFDEGNFSETSLLIDAYHHLSDCLSGSYSQHMFDGLCIEELVLRFRHRVLLLFKLLLLEKRVIFFHSPVKPLCYTLLSLISLHPRLLEKGLFKSFSGRNACSILKSAQSEPLSHAKMSNCKTESDRASEVLIRAERDDNAACDVPGDSKGSDAVDAAESAEGDNVWENGCNVKGDCSSQEWLDGWVADYFSEDIETATKLEIKATRKTTVANESAESAVPGAGCGLSVGDNFLRDVSLENLGLPLSIFDKGNLCLPYMSISYLDFLANSDVRGFHGTATNLLFKQKRQILDVLVDLEGSRIETNCPELRRQLFLTTEDLRFCESLVRGIVERNAGRVEHAEKSSNDDWIRDEFAIYLVTLLRTSLLPEGSKEVEHFNTHFVSAWKTTSNYKEWLSQNHEAIYDLTPGHRFARNMSVSDMRHLLVQAAAYTESGRRINQVVTTTSKAVGGAIVQARGALSQWWSNLTTAESKFPRANAAAAAAATATATNRKCASEEPKI